MSRVFGRSRLDWIRLASLGATAFGALAFGLLALLLLAQSLPLWQHQGVASVLTGTRWFYRAAEFGALPMLFGTGVVAVTAISIAAPIGLGAALWLSELVSRRARLVLKANIELLAGVPSVVYGLLGVLVLREPMGALLARWGAPSGDTLLTGGVLLAIMILPTFTTLADDALQGVPRAQRDAARALGLTRAETIGCAVLPHASHGILAALLLALGRALGETIAVFLVIGRQDNQLPGSWTTLDAWIRPGQTLTSKLGGSETFIALGDPLHWSAIAGLAVLLSAVVLVVTWLGTRALAPERRDDGGEIASPRS